MNLTMRKMVCEEKIKENRDLFSGDRKSAQNSGVSRYLKLSFKDI